MQVPFPGPQHYGYIDFKNARLNRLPGLTDKVSVVDETVISTSGPQAWERVILTGFMGAGKSTVGRLLAPFLGWTFVDVDAALTACLGMTVAQIFELHGELYFREQEAAFLAQSLQSKRTVIAAGGGAVEQASSRALLFTDPGNLVVYLEAPLHVSLARCSAELGASERPVLQDRSVLEERFHQRLPWYRSAHLTVPTEAQSPLAVAQTIAAVVQRSADTQIGRYTG